MDTNLIWNSFLEKIKIQLGTFLYETWFLETKLISLDNGVAKIIVPTPVHITYLQNTYLVLIESVFNEVTNTNATFEFITEEDSTDDINEVFDQNLIQNYHTTNLNSKYTFDNYVVGVSNKVAYSVAVAVADQPGKLYNPLFIYGKSGLGKTHLMQSIGNYIAKHSRNNVIYISAREYLEDYINSLSKDVNVFKDKYRNVDVLIVDDVQFFANADKTQEEFFHTFNILHQNDKQIILSSDRSPDDLKILEDRLRTRFNWGISVNIKPPEFELRREILLRKIKSEKVDLLLNDDVIDYIAHRASNDVRELESTLRLLLANATIFGASREINLDFAIECLKDSNTIQRANKNDLANIINKVCDYFNVTPEEIRGNSRKQSINFPRQVAMYICRDTTEVSFSRIGMEFGNKHHTTVMNSCTKIQKMLLVDPSLNQIVYKIKEKL